MFEVIWLDETLDALADIYVAADLDTQDRMTAAVERLKPRLRNYPLDQGESRSGRRRIVFIDGLVVLYSAYTTEHIVHVTGVMRYGR